MQHVTHLRIVETPQAEQAGLLDLGQIGGAVAELGGDRHGQHHLEQILGQRRGAGFQPHFALGLPLLGENHRGIGRLQRDILQIDLLNFKMLGNPLLLAHA